MLSLPGPPHTAQARRSITSLIHNENSVRRASEAHVPLPNDWITKMSENRIENQGSDPFLKTLSAMDATRSRSNDLDEDALSKKKIYLHPVRKLHSTSFLRDAQRTFSSTLKSHHPLGVGGKLRSVASTPATMLKGGHHRMIPISTANNTFTSTVRSSRSGSPPPPSNITTTAAAPPLHPHEVAGNFVGPLIAMFRGPRAHLSPVSRFKKIPKGSELVSPLSVSGGCSSKCPPNCSHCSSVQGEIRTFEDNKERLLYKKSKEDPTIAMRKELDRFYSAKVIQVLRFQDSTSSPTCPTLAQLFDGLTSVQLEELFIHCIGSIHGSMSIDRFRTLMIQLVGPQFSVALNDEVVEKMFRLFDGNGNGRVDFVEFMSTLSVSLQSPDVVSFVGKLFSELDKKANGFVTRATFMDTPSLAQVYKTLQQQGFMVAFSSNSDVEKNLTYAFLETMRELAEDDRVSMEQFRVLCWTTPTLLQWVYIVAKGEASGSPGRTGSGRKRMARKQSKISL
eukprot:PhF_6_TR35360/c0_g1_i1/m.51324